MEGESLYQGHHVGREAIIIPYVGRDYRCPKIKTDSQKTEISSPGKITAFESGLYGTISSSSHQTHPSQATPQIPQGFSSQVLTISIPMPFFQSQLLAYIHHWMFVQPGRRDKMDFRHVHSETR